MVGKKSKGLFLRVFALMDPKVGPMALGTCAGSGAIWKHPWDQILIPPSGLAGLYRPKTGVLHSEKVTYTGLYPLKGDPWHF